MFNTPEEIGALDIRTRGAVNGVCPLNSSRRVDPAYGGVPTGSIEMYVGGASPAGWLFCDGSSLLRIGTYADLFAVIGVAFGAVDGTHFSLPDFRGIFPKGAGTTNRAAGVDANGTSYSGVLGTYSQDKEQGHYHQSAYKVQSLNVAAGATQAIIHNILTNSTDYAQTMVTNGSNGTPRIGSTTEPQSLGINFIIKY